MREFDAVWEEALIGTGVLIYDDRLIPRGFMFGL